jgi:nucleolar protein 56
MSNIRLWFGDFKIENGQLVDSTIVQKDVPTILKRIKSGDISDLDRNCRSRFRSIALSSGFVKSEPEYIEILRHVMIELAREKIAKAENQQDQQIIQSVESLDDIDESINLLSERLNEWRGFKFGYLKGEELEAAIISSAQTGHETAALKLASAIMTLRETRRQIADYIAADMRVFAPNLANIAGELLGARLISKAGGLDNLAKMPSSTVQVIGASKALFKHLRYGTKPPKHGIIYHHPLISKSRALQRGKIARVLASKISIAARLDNFSNNFNPDLLIDLEKKVEKIKKLSNKLKQDNERKAA